MSLGFLTLITLTRSEALAAETPPSVRAEWIDSDGQVSATQWRSGSSWVWSQNHLNLQTVIEIPQHLAEQLPASLASRLREKDFKGPIPLQDDHLFLLLELSQPVTIFKLDQVGRQSLRVTADFDHTNWMRHANCRQANPSLAQLDVNESVADADVQDSNPDAFFLSIYCRPASGGTWIEIANSSEVSLSFDPEEPTRFQRTLDGTAFWIPYSERAFARNLAKITVTGSNGEATTEYALTAVPVPVPTVVKTEPLLVSQTRGQLEVKAQPSAVVGLQAQVVSASGTLNAGRTGQAATEVAVMARIEHELASDNDPERAFDRALELDFEIPVRRIGMGLDAKGASTTFGWLNAGYKIKADQLSWTLGIQASMLDVRSPNRTSILSVSPSATGTFRRLYSLTIAPFDLSSSLSTARARADYLLTADGKNRLVFEAFLGRTWMQPQASSWNMNAVTFGFAGAF